MKKLTSVLCLLLAVISVAATSTLFTTTAYATSIADLTAGEQAIFYTEEDEVKYTAINSSADTYIGGLVVSGSVDYEYKLATIDMTNTVFLNAQTPVFTIMPYFYPQRSNDGANFVKTVGFYDIYVTLTSVSNPDKYMSFMFGTRAQDNYEMNITAKCDGENTLYGGESWHKSKEGVEKEEIFSTFGRGTAINTQMFGFDGGYERETFKDKNNKSITRPYPISVYYDANTHYTYTDTGYYKDGGDMAFNTRIAKGGGYRYTIRDLDFTYNEENGSAWTPWTEQEASAVTLSFRFAAPTGTQAPCKTMFYAIGGTKLNVKKDGTNAYGATLASTAIKDRISYEIKYMLGDEYYSVDHVAVDSTVTEPKEPKRDGYYFGGWYEGETKYEFGFVPASDKVLVGKWKVACQCGNLIDEHATKCDVCGKSTGTNGDDEKKGCGKDAVTMLAAVLSALATALVIKRK